MKKIQDFTCRIVMMFLFLALRTLAVRDSRVRATVSAYRDGEVFKLRAGMGDGAPVLAFRVQNGGLKRVDFDAPADLDITIKSLPDAFDLFTGQNSVAEAYAEHRFYLKGNPFETMGLVRAIEIAEAYLFPSFISEKLFDVVPACEFSPVKLYALMLMKG